MIKFYKDNTGAYVLGPNDYSYAIPGQYYAITRGDYLALFLVSSNQRVYDSPYFEYEDKNGTPYTSLSALMTTMADFFFPPGSMSGGYLSFTDSESGFRGRVGWRDGEIVIDKELTTTGFSGTQGVDWENIGGFN